MAIQGVLPWHADLIYDVGMHRGEDAAFYLKKGFRVVGFEADPHLAGECRKRFAQHLADGRMVIVEGAIIDSVSIHPQEDQVEFYRNLDCSLWGTASREYARIRRHQRTSLSLIRVPPVQFRACLRQYGVPYYMKIDIEGQGDACLKALEGGANKPQYLSIEWELSGICRAEATICALEKLGYTAFQLVNQNRVFEQVPPAPPREGWYASPSLEPGASGLLGRELPPGWKSRDEVLRECRILWLVGRLLGERSWLGGLWTTRVAVPRLKARKNDLEPRHGSTVLRKLLGRLHPGWYDIHARHISARGDALSARRRTATEGK
jgi:FkbM family methyltransferase